MFADEQPQRLGRRAFLRNGTLLLAAAPGLDARSLFADEEQPRLRFGVMTDLHYADKPPSGTRHYRETPAKLDEAAARIAESEPEFVVELGDLIDAADSRELELDWLKRIDKEFAAIAKDRHYVLGNHCVTTLTKAEFLDGVEQEASYYSFDRGGFHFVVLDSCFRGDGEPLAGGGPEGHGEEDDRPRPPAARRDQQPRREERSRRPPRPGGIRACACRPSGAQP
jgi:hypothetical protein